MIRRSPISPLARHSRPPRGGLARAVEYSVLNLRSFTFIYDIIINRLVRAVSEKIQYKGVERSRNPMQSLAEVQVYRMCVHLFHEVLDALVLACPTLQRTRFFVLVPAARKPHACRVRLRGARQC